MAGSNRPFKEIVVESGQVKSVSRLLCAKHHDKLQCVRNYSDSFVKGIERTAIKKENILKHQKSEQHTRALRYESEPMSMLDVYSKTPLEKALANSERADRDNVGRLIEIVYMMAKRALPFNNFNSLCSMEWSFIRQCVQECCRMP